jgi:hypothetical protein
LAKLWPSVLISVLALDLPLVTAYFPAQFHWYFKSRDNVMMWQLPSSFKAAVMPVGVAVLLSRSIDFLDRVLADLVHCQRLIVPVDMPRRGVAPKTHREDRAKAQKLMHKHGMRLAFFLDLDNGGANDACHVFGFGNNLGSSVLPASDQGLTQTLCHFLDGGTEGHILDSHRVLKT